MAKVKGKMGISSDTMLARLDVVSNIVLTLFENGFGNRIDIETVAHRLEDGTWQYYSLIHLKRRGMSQAEIVKLLALAKKLGATANTDDDGWRVWPGGQD